MKRKVILASTSPRRQELLAKLGLDFDVANVDYEEDMTLKLPPKKLAMHLAAGKAYSVVPRFPNALIIAADSIVVLDSKVYGKPRTIKKAKAMLRLFSAKKHSIITGMVVIDTATGKIVSRVVESKVYFKRLTESVIHNYLKTGQGLDRAGGYAIQDLASVFVKRIDGDYFAALGLSTFELAEMLAEFNIYIL